MNNRVAIVFTINDSYAIHCCTTIVSILENNKWATFDFYIITDKFSDKNEQAINKCITKYNNSNKLFIKTVDIKIFENLKNNITYISPHTYIRFIIADVLSDIKKALYLDADLIINGDLYDLWNTGLNKYICAGAKDLYVEKSQYKYTIGMDSDDVYINAGVLLLNLEEMRKQKISGKLFDTAANRLHELSFQDQDIINLTLRKQILQISNKYNYTSEDAINATAENPVIIHYTGRIKPWNIAEKCRNKFRHLYFTYLNKTPYNKFNTEFKIKRFIRNIKKMSGINVKPKKIKAALIIDEYFGGMNTAFGGYGFLARHYIAKYLPDENISLEVLLAKNKKKWTILPESKIIDGVKVIIPPGKKFVKQWLNRQKYDIFITIELTHDILKYDRRNTPVIHWIQDPRPWSEWQEIQTVKLFPESCYWNSELYDIVNRLYLKGNIKFVSQGKFLNEKALMLYRLPQDTEIQYMPNPIDIDYTFDPKTFKKKNNIIFIGRIESVKRGWLFCEIAKQMPEYEFYMLGQTFREKSENESIMSKYREGIPNLHFVGHVEGEDKNKYIKEAKILVNTSIHEALPVTFLEALSYGTLLVSCRNPEDLTSKFGTFVGTVLGDGFEDVPKFVDAIRNLITNEALRSELSEKAIDYIKEYHSVKKFQNDMRELIHTTLKR